MYAAQERLSARALAMRPGLSKKISPSSNRVLEVQTWGMDWVCEESEVFIEGADDAGIQQRVQEATSTSTPYAVAADVSSHSRNPNRTHLAGVTK